MSSKETPQAPASLVDKQIDELLESRVTNIRFPENKEYDDVIGRTRSEYRQCSTSGQKYCCYVLILYESEVHAMEMDSTGDFEIQSDSFSVYMEPPENETGPIARVGYLGPGHLYPSAEERRKERRKEKKMMEKWRQEIHSIETAKDGVGYDFVVREKSEVLSGYEDWSDLTIG